MSKVKKPPKVRANKHERRVQRASERLLGALPGSLHRTLTPEKIHTILTLGSSRVEEVNGCTLEEVHDARPRVRQLGLIVIPQTQDGKLVALNFSKK